MSTALPVEIQFGKLDRTRPRILRFLGLVQLALLFLLVSGCKKSAPPSPETKANSQFLTPEPIDPNVIASLHWLGKKRISTGLDAVGLMGIWNLPESTQLESHALDKIALAPWVLAGKTNTALTDPAPQLFRGIAEDLLQEESYLEVRRETDSPATSSIGFAIRLTPERSTAWTRALPTILESLQRPSNDIQISPSGEWTFVGVGSGTNSSVAAMKARLDREHQPFPAPKSNFWAEAHIDLAQSKTSLDWLSPSNSPVVDLNLIGDGKDVLTRALLTFTAPLGLNLDHWDLPVQMIASQPMGLTAINGVRPLLAKTGIFTGLSADSVPNQIVLWDRRGIPLQMFFAFPTKTAQQTFDALAPKFADFLQAHSPPGSGSALMNPTNSTFIWQNFVFGTPFLHAVTNEGVSYLLGGFALPSVTRSNRMPPEIAAHIMNATNLVYYDLEHTGERISHWRYFDDTWRIMSDASHSPRVREGQPGVDWIANASSNLTYCTSELRLENPKTLIFARKSTIGLSSLEIDIIANWLEMPSFPLGFNTLWHTSSVPTSVIQRKSNPNR